MLTQKQADAAASALTTRFHLVHLDIVNVLISSLILHELVQDQSPDVRAAAGEALRKLGR